MKRNQRYFGRAGRMFAEEVFCILERVGTRHNMTCTWKTHRGEMFRSPIKTHPQVNPLPHLVDLFSLQLTLSFICVHLSANYIKLGKDILSPTVSGARMNPRGQSRCCRRRACWLMVILFTRRQRSNSRNALAQAKYFTLQYRYPRAPTIRPATKHSLFYPAVAYDMKLFHHFATQPSELWILPQSK